MQDTPILERLTAQMRSESVYSELATMKKNLALTSEESIRIDEYFKNKIDSLLESLQDVAIDGDETEVRRLLSHIWIEYRMEWIRYNTQMQYQTVIQGQAKPLLMGIGSALSFLIQLVERYLSIDELYWVTKLAADPIAFLSSRNILTNRIVDIAHNIGTAGCKIMEDVSQLRDQSSSRHLDANSSVAMDKRINATVDNIENLLASNMALNSTDLSESLEMILTTNLKSSPVNIVVHKDLESDEASIPAETISGLNSLFSVWLQTLIRDSIEKNIEERRAKNKTDHVQIIWKITKRASGRLIITFKDDGCGKISSIQLPNLPSDWRIDYHNNEQGGSEVLINFRGSQSIEMLTLGLHEGSHMYPFAIPKSNIISVVPNSGIILTKAFEVQIANVGNTNFVLIDLLKYVSEEMVACEPPVFKTKAYLQIKDSETREYVICINEIFQTVRGATRAGQTMLSFVEGYVLVGNKLISVIDVDLLAEVVDGKRQARRAA
jgi:hypothetical protein